MSARSWLRMVDRAQARRLALASADELAYTGSPELGGVLAAACASDPVTRVVGRAALQTRQREALDQVVWRALEVAELADESDGG